MAFTYTFYLCRLLGGEDFEIVQTTTDPAVVRSLDLSTVPGDVRWHQDVGEFSPTTHKWGGDESGSGGIGFVSKLPLREVMGSEILRLLVSKGIVTVAEIEAWDPRVANLLRLRRM